MTIKLYKDPSANSIFIEDANGAQFLNSLQASVVGTTIVITDLAKQIDIVSNMPHAEFVDEYDNPYAGTAIEVCNELNAVFSTAGTPSTDIPNITSTLNVNLTEGETLNYELTADYGVGYEWDLSNVTGITTVEGNVRKLVGGSSLGVGTYNIPVKAINYNGEDSQTVVLTVSTPPFSNTKSIQFNNQDYIGANAALLEPILGRTGNGSGSSDAWTLSFWFKPSSDSRGQVIMYYGQGISQGAGGYIELRQTNVGNQKRLRIRYGSHSNYLQLTSPNGSLTPNIWQHVVVVYDGGTTGSGSSDLGLYYGRFKVYIDGVIQTLNGAHNNYGYSSSLQTGNFRFGRLNSGNSLRGANLDEIAIWGSDKSADVSSMYNSGSPLNLATGTSVAVPEHWWRMGDGDTYPYLQDSGSLGNCIFEMYNMTSADIVSDVP